MAGEGEIRELRHRWLAAVAMGDVSALAGLMTDDVIVVHPDGRTTGGRDAVLAEFEALFRRHTLEQSFAPAETVVAGDWAFDRGDMVSVVTSPADGEQRRVVSHVLNLVRRGSDGRWRVARTLSVSRG